jgi:hypothetical protein
MSHKNYFPDESKSQIEKWLDDCPRELANVVLVNTFTILPDGTTRSLGMQSIVETSGADALEMFDRAIETLTKHKLAFLLKALQE